MWPARLPSRRLIFPLETSRVGCRGPSLRHREKENALGQTEKVLLRSRVVIVDVVVRLVLLPKWQEREQYRLLLPLLQECMHSPYEFV